MGESGTSPDRRKSPSLHASRFIACKLQCFTQLFRLLQNLLGELFHDKVARATHIDNVDTSREPVLATARMDLERTADMREPSSERTHCVDMRVLRNSGTFWLAGHSHPAPTYVDELRQAEVSQGQLWQLGLTCWTCPRSDPRTQQPWE